MYRCYTIIAVVLGRLITGTSHGRELRSYIYEYIYLGAAVSDRTFLH